MSSDERARVAREMRYVAYKPGLCHGWGLGSLVNSILTDGAPTPTTPQALLLALADLIDPTCEVVSENWMVNKTTGERHGGCSLSCGHIVMNDVPAYCPFCGARVVDGDE